MQGNLFIVSRLGQVRNVQTLIRQEGATGNHLVVLETNANPGLTAVIAANTEAGLFEEITHITQPEQPLKQGRRKNRIIYTQMEETLVRLAEKGVVNLFLCNLDSYYSFFGRIIEDRRLTMTVNLLEEGLGTYANLASKQYVKVSRADWDDVALRTKNAGKACVHAVRSVAILIATFLSWLFRVDLFRVRRELRLLTVEPRYRYGRLTHFDNAYVCFPDKVHTDAVSIGTVKRLDFEIEPASPGPAVDAIDDDAVVFVSQKYVSRAEYIGIVFSILDEMGVRRVYFKFHPRESRASFGRAWDDAAKEHPRLEALTPDAIQSVPVEQLMASGKVRQVVGLTSTSLMYGAEFFDGIDVVSVGERFRQLALSDAFDVSKKALGEFDRDLAVFLDVSGVSQYKVR